MKCYDMKVLDAEMSFFFSQETTFSQEIYVNLGKSHNLINNSITKWRVFEPTLHLGFQTVEI